MLRILHNMSHNISKVWRNLFFSKYFLADRFMIVANYYKFFDFVMLTSSQRERIRLQLYWQKCPSMAYHIYNCYIVGHGKSFLKICITKFRSMTEVYLGPC